MKNVAATLKSGIIVNKLDSSLCATSGIEDWPVVAQASVFAATYACLASGTWAGSSLLDTISKSNLESWRNNFIDKILPLSLGALYLTAGVGHFVAAESFRDIYPLPGTWGFWYLPGSAAFHVAWTGAVEVAGGLGLLYAGINNDELEIPSSLIQPISALTLFLLTIVVTPANIYMFTHGAVMGEMEPLDLSFHVTRFFIQIILLSSLLILAKDSFFFAWGDELD
mmetsp:Transcript_33314/g.50258  ORF Transcript_33314/g.50258 Transcript_33314/m.50258 type:complete len:225 (-) Transcript_33314:223-897(-)